MVLLQYSMFMYIYTWMENMKCCIFDEKLCNKKNIMKNKRKRLSLVLSFCMAFDGLALQSCNEATPQMQKDKLNRGVVAVRESSEHVIISWRYLSSDPLNTSFNVYRDGEKIAEVPANQGTFYKDTYAGTQKALYEVKAVVNGKEKETVEGVYTLPENAPLGYLNIPLDIPAEGVTPAGDTYTYNANDASMGDVDGDGQYEIILKWDPSNAHDNAHDGYTGNVYFDCYRLTGEKLWRIDMGKNVRAGAHYTQFMVYDLDGDGCAEIVMKTSDGTVDGTGAVIGDASADYREPGDTAALKARLQQMASQPKKNMRPRNAKMGQRRPQMPPRKPTPPNQGRILTGNEYLTIFNGLTGKAMQTIDYVPQRGRLEDWGDNRANRADRYLAAVAYLDGLRPSVIMCRGYYTRAVLAAFDWDGKELKQRWVFDTKQPGNEAYEGQGNHNLRVADVDGDGFDEIVYGQCAIDHDGTGLYSTGMNHGDAMHLTKFSPDMEGYQVWGCHENKKDGTSFRDAATGKVIFQVKCPKDVGRCMAADIDPNNSGVEMWSWETNGLRNIKGEVINPELQGFSANMGLWWDGDLLRELLDRNAVSKYDWNEKVCKPLQVFDGVVWNNGSKSNPCLQGDMIGDWREEVLFRTEDNSALRLYVSTIPTDYRFHTFLEDPAYRISIVTQNVAYNQPTQPGFYFGADLKEGVFRGYEFK